MPHGASKWFAFPCGAEARRDNATILELSELYLLFHTESSPMSLFC